MKLLSKQEASALITSKVEVLSESESEDDGIVLNGEPSGLRDIMQEIIRNANQPKINLANYS